MKTYPFNFLLAFFVLFQSLSCTDHDCFDCGGLVEAKLIVSDTRGNPIKNHKVSLSGRVVKQIQQTDENGAVHFDFLWNSAVKDIVSSWAIYPADGYDFKRTSMLVSPNTHGEQDGKITIWDTLFMETLTPFKIRVKTQRNDVEFVNIKIQKDGLNFDENKFLGHSGAGIQNAVSLRQDLASELPNNLVQSSTPKLDTIIEVKVFESSEFNLNCTFGYTNSPTDISKKVKISSSFPRDSVLFIKF